MRKVFLLFLVIPLSTFLNASEAELFSYDRGKLTSALKELDKFEEIVNQNPGPDFTELIKNSQIDLASFDANSVISQAGEPPLGVPSFLWGCVFGVAGIIVVLIMTDKDKNEILQALYGCITTYVIIGLFYMVVFYNSI